MWRSIPTSSRTWRNEELSAVSQGQCRVEVLQGDCVPRSKQGKKEVRIKLNSELKMIYSLRFKYGFKGGCQMRQLKISSSEAMKVAT